MPKIKFTALVSDMKGKANGSVFSTNQGGTYFRNNPRHVGGKSSAWDSQKATFGSLASQWRNLTDPEQESWTTMAPNYPTLNAFGDPRIPTGYELFMRLNGRLTAIGLPFLAVPVAPRSIPPLTQLDNNYPDEFQLNPNVAATSFDQNDPNVQLDIRSAEFDSGIDIEENYSFGIRIQFPDFKAYPRSVSGELRIAAFADPARNGYFLSFIDLNTTIPKLQLDVRLPAGSVLFSAPIPAEAFNSSMHIAVTTVDTSTEDSLIYLNGELLATTDTPVGDTSTGTFDPFVNVGRDVTGNELLCYFSDIRMYKATLDAASVLLLSSGYILNSEFILFPCYEQSNGEFESFANQTGALTLDVTGFVSTMSILFKINFALIPHFSLLTTVNNDPDYVLNVYASPPVSHGKSGAYDNFKLIASVDYLGFAEVFVFSEYKAIYSNVPAKTQVRFRAQVVDVTNGNAPSNATEAAKKGGGFKAGSELSGKVN